MVTVPIGGCCCPGECENTCSPCDPVVASDYCFCLYRITHTQVGGDCPSFEIEFYPPICVRGECTEVSPTIVLFDSTPPTEYEVDGRTLTIEWGGNIRCIGGAFNYYLLSFDLSGTTLSGCDLEIPDPGVSGIADTFTGDHCDIDSMLGTYTPLYISTTTFDTLELEITLTKGGSCPP